jgi:predicted amidohydrolase YtcJ
LISIFWKINNVPSVQPPRQSICIGGRRLGSKHQNGVCLSRLLKQNGWFALGTDFPCEDINPFKTFFGFCCRKDAHNYPENGFQRENA